MRVSRWHLFSAGTLPFAIALSLSLTACSGETEQAGPSPEPSTSASAAPQPSSSGSATTPAPANPPGEVPDPCAALTKEEATEVVGHEIKIAKTSEALGSKLCAYTPVKATTGPSVTTQIGPLIGELENTSKYISGQFDDVKITEIDVTGASEARLITGKLAKSNAVVIVLVKDNMFYQILLADSGIKVKDLTKMATKGAEAMTN